MYPYFQENPDPLERDREATNRGLIRCMEDGIPVGVLIQSKPKPGVEYHIVGLAKVIDWRDGYFFLEGYDKDGKISLRSSTSDAGLDTARAETLLPFEMDYDPDQQSDQRAKTIAEVVRRRGQGKFRKALLSAYNGRCAITDCDAVAALEAAHITPYLGQDTNHPQNGLLLRADIHSLFDLGLISVEPETLTVVLDGGLQGSSYAELQDRSLASTSDATNSPSMSALRQHYEWSGIGKAS